MAVGGEDNVSPPNQSQSYGRPELPFTSGLLLFADRDGTEDRAW